MNAIKKVRKLVENAPQSKAARTISALVVSLESGTPYNLADLYELNMEQFELALQLLEDWRLQRYYSAKFRLIDASVRASS